MSLQNKQTNKQTNNNNHLVDLWGIKKYNDPSRADKNMFTINMFQSFNPVYSAHANFVWQTTCVVR